jgi:hypothetical protein
MLVGSEASLYKARRSADIDLSCAALTAQWQLFRGGASSLTHSLTHLLRYILTPLHTH